VRPLSGSGETLSARTAGSLAQTATLTLARPSPITDQVGVGQGVPEAVEPDRAAGTELLGPGRGSAPIGNEEVDRLIPAGGVDLPIGTPGQLLDQGEIVNWGCYRFGGLEDAHISAVGTGPVRLELSYLKNHRLWLHDAYFF
jgi:hypothetical protein